ncbi:protein MAINTENANCE OF MERISTEMS-like, partial [Rutidosis leptorrhynchoides]|uniref:protein MAINTENANCE OF MERISTEMS-like n=1 Tax=Rutidosis leptorrhynchoides TaxID=125765 RepID=UPI003A992944
MAQRSSWIPQGLKEEDLLWFQPQHRSLHIYLSDEQCDRALIVRRADVFFWECRREAIYLIPRVDEFIEMMGFGLVSTVGYMEYGHHLLTALAERWRPETHSFHLCVGDATITLEDVEVLLGLRTDGLPVTDRESYPADIAGYL